MSTNPTHSHKTLSQIAEILALMEESNKNKSWIGWEGLVIATGIGSKGGIICRNPSYKSYLAGLESRFENISHSKTK